MVSPVRIATVVLGLITLANGRVLAAPAPDPAEPAALANIGTRCSEEPDLSQRNCKFCCRHGAKIRFDTRLNSVIFKASVRRDNIDERGPYHGGDMRLNEDQLAGIKQGIIGSTYLWPGGSIPYVLDTYFSELRDFPIFDICMKHDD